MRHTCLQLQLFSPGVTCDHGVFFSIRAGETYNLESYHIRTTAPTATTAATTTTTTTTTTVAVVSKTKHSKTKTEARSTQISKTKHPKLEITVG